MTSFLIRRFIQIIIVIFLSAVVSYVLLAISPGNPIDLLQSEMQCNPRCPTLEDIARLKARYDLDVYLPFRFTRWFLGVPDGPLSFGGQQWFADFEVGCAIPRLVRLRYGDGREEIVEEGCERPVTLANLEGRFNNSNGILFGDFGLSQQILRDRPVSILIESRLPYTLVLMGVSNLLAILIAVPMGIYSAVRQYSPFDYVMTTIGFIGISLPSFFFGVLMILIFSIFPTTVCTNGVTDCLPPLLPPGSASAVRDYDLLLLGRIEAGSLLDYLLHFIMPCFVLTFISIAFWSRFVRSSMLEVLRQDYIRAARAKGVREHLIILKHGFRNALIPFITLLAGILPNLFAGAAITEAVFNWPGLGRLLLDALGRSDYPVAMALLYVTIVLQLIGYLISDVLYTVADPRIRLS